MKRFPLYCCFFILLVFLTPTLKGQKGRSLSPVSDTGLMTFQVDLSQWAALGRFNPATDSIDMPGTFNDWKGSALLQKIGSSAVYGISFHMDSTTEAQFRFRINRDSNRMEFPGSNPRMFRVPDHPMTLNYVFNDYDTTTVPITFQCRMKYEISAGLFNPNALMDYLDVADSLGTWAAYAVLFDSPVDSTRDSIYQVKLNLPKSLISNITSLKFKFRINGSWNTSEFPGNEPFRTYFLKDTTGGVSNLVDAWYADIDPAIPAAPYAYDVIIQGRYAAKQILTGSYKYGNHHLLPEGVSRYRWYLADSITQVNLVPVGDSTINYVVDSLNAGKYIAFDVTPVAAGTGDSLIGKTVRAWTGKIGAVGIDNLELNRVLVFPNPATDQISFDNLGTTDRIEIYSIFGQKIALLETRNQSRASMNISGLGKGLYVLKFSRADGFSTSKFIKQ